MMDDQAYFDWLISQVSSRHNKNPSRTYTMLLEQLHRKPFEWSVPNDDNRVEDGLELRYEFLNGPVDDHDGCTFLEMLLALSRRVAFEEDGAVGDWFWHLMENLELRQYNDETYSEFDQIYIDHILNRVIDRTYDFDGLGGLFPLKEAHQDQRKIELWYQMSSYLLEGNGP